MECSNQVKSFQKCNFTSWSRCSRMRSVCWNTNRILKQKTTNVYKKVDIQFRRKNTYGNSNRRS